MGCVMIVVFHDVLRSLSELSQTAYINFFVLRVLKIFYKLLFVQKSLQITADATKTLKSAQGDIPSF